MDFKKSSNYYKEFKFLYEISKEIHFLFLISFFLILILAFIETTIIGSVIPVVDLLLDKEKFTLYQLAFNKNLNLSLSYEKFIKVFFIFLILIFFISSIIQLSTVFLSAHIREKISFELRNLIIRNYLTKKKNEYFNKAKVGDLIQKLLVHTINSASVIWELLLIFRNLIISLFIYVFLLMISFKLTLYLTVFFIILGLVFFQLGRSFIIKKTHLRNLYQSQIFSLSNVILSSIKIIKIFKRENYFSQKFYDESFGYKNKERLLQTLSSFPGILIKLIFVVILLSILFYLLNKNNFSLSNLSFYAIFIGASYKLTNLFGEINNRFYSVVNFLPSISIVMKEIDAKTFDINEKNISNKISLVNFKKVFRLNNVFFSYKEDTSNLNGINIEIKKNSITALLGPSGSGKSTLLDTICGFNKIEGGSYEIDGSKINDKDEIKFDKISYSNQDQIIFSGSIKENITFFENKKNIDNQKLDLVIDICEIREMMESKKITTDYKLNEKGLELSGGEKQRINLARALYLSKGFFVLDEPLSNVQKTLEEKIMKKIVNYARKTETTLIIVSHSLKSVSSADQIIILKNGKIIDKGVHDKLIKRNNYYRENFDLNEY